MDDSSATSGVTTPCPECGAAIQVDTRAMRWCLDCEWNLDPSGSIGPRARRVARRNEALADRLLRHGGQSRPDLGATFALVLGVVALMLAPLCLVGGVAIVVAGRHSPLLIGLGVILAVLAVAVRPRPPRLDDRYVVVEADRAPRFWELLREIAAAVETEPPERVVVDLAPSASVVNIGRGSRTVLQLGAPLWAILDRQERVGLLAHELGHLSNGDPRRGRLVWLGTQTLTRWWVALVPPPSTRQNAPLQWVENVVMAGLRGMIRLWLAAIARLQIRAVQRAELRSDHVAARMAGWAGYTQLLNRLRYGHRLGHATQLAAARRDGVDFYTSLVDSVESLPPQEEERLRRLAAREPYDPGLTHPPARLRVRAVEDLRAEIGLVVPDTDRWTSIDAELAPAMGAVAQQARDDHDATTDRYTGRRPAKARRRGSPSRA
jgi:Zn-dependent protease with chaperone function